MVAIHLEEATQVGAGIGTPEAIGAQHGVVLRHERTDLLGESAHVIGGGNRRAGTAFEQRGDVRHLRRLGFRMQAIPAFGVVTVATQFGEARTTPDVGSHAEFLVEQLGCRHHFTQDGARTEQLHAQLTLLRLAAILEQVHALDDALGRAFGHVGVSVVLVHQGEVVVLIHLLGQHPLHAVLQDHGHFETERRIVSAAIGNGTGQKVRMAILVLQAFAVERGATSSGAEQEATRTHVGGLPGRIANALKTEHRIENEERQQRQIVVAVTGGAGHPRRERAGFGDAFLQHLPGLILAVVHELVGIDRLVLLPERGIDADLPEQAFHAEGAGFVGHDGHHARADLLVAQDDVEGLHEGHGGADFALAGALEQTLEVGQRRHFERLAGFLPALRQETTQLGATRLHVLHFRRIFAGVVERHLAIGQLRIGNRNVEAIAEGAHGFVVELLGLMGGIERFARRTHAVTLHRLGQDHRGHAGGVHRLMVGGVDLVRIMAATVEAPDIVIGHVGHHRGSFRVFAEEMLARVRAAECLAVLVFAVDGFHHQLAQHAVGIACQQRIPIAAPHQLDDVPARAAEHAFQFLDDLAVAAHRAIEPLQVAVDDEHEVVQALAPGNGNRAQAFRLVALAIAHEAPDLAIGFRQQAAMLQILAVARLIDRRNRPQPHGHRRHLPVIGHQPRVGIGRDALPVHFHAEMVELGLAEAAFEERARIDAGAGMALHAEDVAGVAFAGCAPEMIEAHVVQGGRTGEAGDMAAQIAGLAVGAHHHRHRVPADQRTDAPLHRVVAGAFGLHLRRDGVDVFGGGRKGQETTGAARLLDQ